MVVSIPDDILSALEFNEEELLLELAIALYAARKISFGKARRLARMDWYRFREVLSERNIPAHYEIEQFEEDLASVKTLPVAS
jgi:predicted HTH domain antitoxin